MKVSLQVSDKKTGGRNDYEREEIATLTLNVTAETIPALVELVSAAITAHLTTKLHAASLGVDPKKSPEDDE